MDRYTGEQLNLLGVAIANSLAQNFTADEIAVLAALFCVIGDALGLIAASDT